MKNEKKDKESVGKKSQKKGAELESILSSLMESVLKEWGFTPVELRPQTSGYQFGKDKVARWVGKLKGKRYEFKWSIESKAHGTPQKHKLIPREELSSKLTDIYSSSANSGIDCWCIFAPFGYVDNPFYETVNSANEHKQYPFQIVLWTSHQQVENLIECFPNLYRQLYGKEPPVLSDKERTKRLGHWKKMVLDNTVSGRAARDSSKQKAESEGSGTQALATDISKSVKPRFGKEVLEKRVSASKEGTNVSSVILPLSPNAALEKIRIQERIKSAKEALDKGKFSESLLEFASILYEIDSSDEWESLREEKARVYNNIGVVYNAKGDVKRSLEYFQKALKENPDFVIAQTNIANAYISLSESLPSNEAQAELDKARTILDLLIAENQDKEPRVIQSQMRWLRAKSGVAAVVDYISENENNDVGTIFKEDASLAYLIGATFLSVYTLDKALEYSEKALSLERDVETLTLHGRVLLTTALREDVIIQQSYDDIAPKFSSTQRLQQALSDFDEAMNIAISNNSRPYIEDLVPLQQMAMTWLNLDPGKIRDRLPEFPLPENKFVEAVAAFRKRDFDVSVDLLQRVPEYEQLPASEIHRLARAYLFNGAVEIAEKLLRRIEEVAVRNNVSTYWLDRSVAEVLLQDKNQAILSTKKAISVADNPDDKRVAYSHSGALLLRYAQEDGGDRMLENAFKFSEEFPELDILTRIDFEKDKDKVIKMIQDKQEWVRDIQEKFKASPIPVYYLEKVFRRPFILVWAGRDPLMPVEYTITSEDFHRELKENYDKGNIFVFDYISLLTLSRLNMLYMLESIFPQIQISFSLFQKIQEELLHEENPDLRRLWEFLRKSKTIQIEKVIPELDLANGRVDGLFDEWFVDTLKLAKQPGAVLVTDDFRLYHLSKSEKIVPLNTWYILQHSVANGQLDGIMYSKALGVLAERFYTFIGFSGDDLYQIVADDDYKLTARTYHLINQAFLPGSNPETFTKVFIPFISKLWLSGALTKDKVFWLSYVTNISTDMVKHILEKGMDQQLIDQIATDMALIWNVAITGGREEDLIALRADLDKILEKQFIETVKEAIIQKIEDTIKSKKKS